MRNRMDYFSLVCFVKFSLSFSLFVVRSSHSCSLCVCLYVFWFLFWPLRTTVNFQRYQVTMLLTWFALCCQIGYDFSFYYWLVCVAAAATMNSSMSLKTKHKSNLERAFHCRIFAFNMMIIMKNTIKILSQSRRKSLMTQFFVLYEEKEIVDRFSSANKFLLFHCTENLGHRILYRLLTLCDSFVFDILYFVMAHPSSEYLSDLLCYICTFSGISIDKHNAMNFIECKIAVNCFVVSLLK